MIAVYKREFMSYLRNMTGPIFMAAVMLFMGIYFIAYNIVQGYPYFAASLSGLSLILLLVVPILTMRSFAEERKTKTDQLLLTSPLSVAQIVLGKYLALVSVLGICMLVSCIAPIVIHCYGSGALLADYVAIIAFFLLGSAYIAIGMFISSLTESQILAAVGTFCILLVLQLIDGLASFPLIPDFLAKISLVSHFDTIINQSFDIAVFVYYISICALFVFLTCQTIQRRRWN